VPPPAVESHVIQGARRTEHLSRRRLEFYPRPYATDARIASHLRFALRHEPIDPGVLVGALKAVDPVEIETWVRAEPTGAFSRRAWFFYETFTGRTLDLEDARVGNYVEALDPDRHIVADTVRRDLKEELGFVAVFDNAMLGVREIVDMPDRRASLFIRLCLQNSGRLSAAKRSSFAELTGNEISRLEAAVQQAIASGAGGPHTA
jgi:hypothetical protein